MHLPSHVGSQPVQKALSPSLPGVEEGWLNIFWRILQSNVFIENFPKSINSYLNLYMKDREGISRPAWSLPEISTTEITNHAILSSVVLFCQHLLNIQILNSFWSKGRLAGLIWCSFSFSITDHIFAAYFWSLRSIMISINRVAILSVEKKFSIFCANHTFFSTLCVP